VEGESYCQLPNRGSGINAILLLDLLCMVCIIAYMNSREIIKALKKDGWELVHVKGSHHQYKHPTKPGKVTVPHPKKDLPMSTVRSIYKQAGLK